MSKPLSPSFLAEFNTLVQQSQAELVEKALKIAEKHGVEKDRAIAIFGTGTALGIRKALNDISSFPELLSYSEALAEGFKYGMTCPIIWNKL